MASEVALTLRKRNKMKRTSLDKSRLGKHDFVLTRISRDIRPPGLHRMRRVEILENLPTLWEYSEPRACPSYTRQDPRSASTKWLSISGPDYTIEENTGTLTLEQIQSKSPTGITQSSEIIR